eukprot:scaffold3345_cov164-Ochromonas_danica.AAC.1
MEIEGLWKRLSDFQAKIDKFKAVESSRRNHSLLSEAVFDIEYDIKIEAIQCLSCDDQKKYRSDSEDFNDMLIDNIPLCKIVSQLHPEQAQPFKGQTIEDLFHDLKLLKRHVGLLAHPTEQEVPECGRHYYLYVMRLVNQVERLRNRNAILTRLERLANLS